MIDKTISRSDFCSGLVGCSVPGSVDAALQLYQRAYELEASALASGQKTDAARLLSMALNLAHTYEVTEPNVV